MPFKFEYNANFDNIFVKKSNLVFQPYSVVNADPSENMHVIEIYY